MNQDIMRARYARINWKEVGALTKREPRHSWTWQKPRTRSKVRFIPNPRTSVKVPTVHVSKATSGDRDRHACTVNALAITAQVPFFVAQLALRRAGRKPNTGFDIDKAAAKNRVRGFRFRKVRAAAKGTVRKFIEKHPVGRFLVTTRDHAFAVIHGQVQDWLSENQGRKIVTGAFTVTADNRE